jgi:hypothetical protein
MFPLTVLLFAKAQNGAIERLSKQSEELWVMIAEELGLPVWQVLLG